MRTVLKGVGGVEKNTRGPPARRLFVYIPLTVKVCLNFFFRIFHRRRYWYLVGVLADKKRRRMAQNELLP